MPASAPLPPISLLAIFVLAERACRISVVHLPKRQMCIRIIYVIINVWQHLDSVLVWVPVENEPEKPLRAISQVVACGVLLLL